MVKVNKQINNGIVDSYILSRYDSGIVHLIINTSDKWCQHESLNVSDELSTIRIYNDLYNVCELKIEELKYDLVYKMVKTVVQDKDQINFYFLPYEIITDNEKIIEKVKTERFQRINKLKKD